MGFDRHVRYSADCDVRTDRAGNRMEFTNAAYDAWELAGKPMDGPVYEAMGLTCGAKTDDVYADSATVARKELAALGWTFKSRGRFGGQTYWRAACPDHRDML